MQVGKFHFLIILLCGVLLLNCKRNTTYETIAAQAFSEKLTSSAQIMDVRTPEEFAGGHIKGAINIDWNSPNFAKESSTLDKERPVFVYCLSGGRSASAAAYLQENGFVEVYNLEGGILQWSAAGLPEEGVTSTAKGMTEAAFQQQLETDKIVLVDFYATWCGPCQKMKPFLEEISKEKGENVVVLRINLDENRTLADAMKINALPAIRVYHHKELKFSKDGFMDKQEILDMLAKM
ncbi:MAG: thioredoxin family protein [Chitinophagales bacterium]|nr:thioredoxin family protein [Chitinophagales bacterium]